MADPLSVLSAAAGFVALAAQLGDGLVKFRRLYRDVRYAQDEIEELLFRMGTFKTVLHIAGRRLENSPTAVLPEKKMLESCLTQCKACVGKVQAMVNSLEQDFFRNKASRLKMPFKKDQLQDASREVGDGAQVLDIAVQSFDAALDRHEHKRTENGIRNVSNQISALSANSHAFQATFQGTMKILESFAREQARQQLVIEQRLEDLELYQKQTRILPVPRPLTRSLQGPPRCCNYSLVAATSERTSTTRRLRVSSWPPEMVFEETQSHEKTAVTRALAAKRQRAGEYKLVTIPLPSSMFENQYRLSFNRAAAGFKFALRTEVVVERSTPLMKACFDGDISRVQEILRSAPEGQMKAMLFIQKKDGRTCLHKAVKSGNRKLVTFLLSMGAGDRLDAQGKSRLVLAASSAKITRHGMPENYVEALLELQDEVRRRCDIDDEDIDFNDPERHERELKVHELMLRSTTWTREDRLRTFLLLHSGPPELTATVDELLRSFELDPCDPYVLSTTLRDDIGMPSVFHLIAKAFSRITFLKANPNHIVKIATRAIKAGADIHAVHPEHVGRRRCRQRYWTTPLANMLLDSIHVSKEKLEHSQRRAHIPVLDRPFRRWIYLLERAGVDITEYGQEEAKILQDARFLWDANDKVPSSGSCGPNHWHTWFEQLENFDYGPTIENWKFNYRPSKMFADDLFAKEFWDTVDPGECLEPAEGLRSSVLPGSFPGLGL